MPTKTAAGMLKSHFTFLVCLIHSFLFVMRESKSRTKIEIIHTLLFVFSLKLKNY